MGATNVPPIDPSLPIVDPASGRLTPYGERVLRGLVGRTGGAIDKVEQTHVIAKAAVPRGTIVAASGGLQFGGPLGSPAGDNVGLAFYKTITAVSLLPTAGNAEGEWAYAIDAPKVFETPGSGTGAPCWWSQGAWQSLGGGTSSGPAIGSGTVTTTGAPSAGNLTKFSGATSITSGDLSGDVTTSGALTTTIAANAVTYAKFQKIAAASLFGNPTGSPANGQAITLGTGLSFSGSVLNATGGSGGGGGATFTPPVLASFTHANNPTGGTATSITGGIQLFAPALGGTWNMNILLEATPTPPYTQWMRATFAANPVSQFCDYGIALSDSSGKLVVWEFFAGGGGGSFGDVEYATYSSYTARASFTSEITPALPPPLLGVNDDGTNLNFLISWDGVTSFTVASVSRTAYLTSGPTKIGFFVNGYNKAITVNVAHWASNLPGPM